MIITLKSLPEATAQEVFNRVALHMLKQNAKSTNMGLLTADAQPAMLCLYRGKDSLGSCAAGCLIADDEYNQKFEGKTWSGMVDRKWVPPQHVSLIRKLQNVHDGSSVEDWPRKLAEVAKEFSLDGRVALLSDDFKTMCSVGHGCGLTTLGEAFCQMERHYDLFFLIDEANAKFCALHDEIVSAGGEEVTIIGVMGQDWADREDKEIEDALAKLGGDDID